jgi:hypothetical protein
MDAKTGNSAVPGIAHGGKLRAVLICARDHAVRIRSALHCGVFHGSALAQSEGNSCATEMPTWRNWQTRQT